MNWLFIVIMLMMSAALGASPMANVAMPAVAHVDTEVTTNVVISSWQRGAAKFAFSLSCIATPSNNVEVAFGTDADGDGALAVGETDLVVGWDCGRWFIHHAIYDERFEVGAAPDESVGSLSWEYRLTAAELPARLSVKGDGSTIFGPLCEDSPAWLYDRSWNLMRLTGRGLDSQGTIFSIGTPSDPTAIMFR